MGERQNDPCLDEKDQRGEWREHYLRLALIPGLGPRTMQTLLEAFASPSEVLTASARCLGQLPRIGDKLIAAIASARHDDLVHRVMDHCHRHRVHILFPDDPTFPPLLREIPDPPLVLYTRGEFTAADRLAIAIVGTRHATPYGKSMAEQLARGLSRAGLTIVSGLARGIDGHAHRAVLEMEGRTIAVLGSHVTDVYPPEHNDLATHIEQHGVVVSETHPHSQPKAGVFPARNRLISGLSLGVIVVEAAGRSGALITAGHAGEQGRDLFAVPGPVNARMSQGCNRLIRDGAILIQDPRDVIDHLGPLCAEVAIAPDQVIRHPAELKLNEQEKTVLQVLSAEATDIDEVIVRSGLTVSRVLSTLGALEMRGLVRRLGGRLVQRA